MDGSDAYSNSLVFSDINCGNSIIINAVFPNPVRNNLNIVLNSLEDRPVVLQVVDVTGKIILEEKHVINEGNNDVVLRTEKLSKGLYFININDEEGTRKVKTVRFAKY
ncbi:MAG: hypothetical protein ACI94Y_000777 [Maribacter sp.]|jgi:hypothetical protein